MGFHKRFVDIEQINYYLEKNLELKKLFNADALIFSDMDSFKIFELFQKGVSQNKIKEKIKNI